MIVAEKIIVELKAVRTLASAHEAQLINYLKATNIKIGMLVNFAFPRATIKRLVI